MQSSHSVRFGIFLASLLFLIAGACTKAEKRENNNSGDKPKDTPSDKPSDPNPCLRMKLVDDEDGEEEGEDHEHEEGEEEGEDHDHDDDKVGGSSSSADDCETTSPGPTTPSPTPSPSGSGNGTGWNIGPGLPECEAKGQPWIAVKNKGPGVCDESATLVKYCCSADEISKRFSNASLDGNIQKTLEKGFKLYHCSEKEGKTTMHFAKLDTIEYQTWFISTTASKADDTKGESCTAVTMEDMGYKKPTTTTPPTTSADIPKAIGELLDTSKAGLLDWLKAAEYTGPKFTGDTKVRATAGPHGKVKIFFSTELAKSLKDGETEHPVGSIAVKEIYKDDGKTIDGFSIMAKHKEGTTKDTWFFYEVLGGAPDFKSEKAYAVGGPALCVDCHKKGKDYIQASPP